jgi:non-heme chloroperoxidase
MTESIVMIHGMWGGGWYWENFMKFFDEKGYRCFTPTLRYHDMDPEGTPDPGLGTTSILDYAQDLEEYIRALDEMPILMGHSMGSLLAQILGARGIASRLVLLTPASPSGINALKYSVIKSFWRILTTWGFWRMSHRPTFEEVIYSVLHRLPEQEQRAVYDRLVYESGRAAAEIGFWLLDPRGAAKVDESKVTCPVLVVSGAEDRITPASINRKVANKYKTVSTYKVFDNHAHWVVGEPGWEDIAAYILEWLQQAPKSSDS